MYRALLNQTSINYWEMRRPSPLIDNPKVYWALLQQTSITYWRNEEAPPLIDLQLYIFLLHQTSISYWEMRRPSLVIEPKCTEPYNTIPVEPIREMRRPSPTNWSQVYRFLLHQTSISYWAMQNPSPTNHPLVYRALLHQTNIEPIEKWGDPPLLSNPKCTDPYYTKLV